MIDKKEFKNPSAFWRGMPFWSWNDDLEENEIKRQIREFKKAGLGGFFMHSRVGLVTSYMSKAWMKIIKAAVKEAKKLKMFANLYDEDRWPSGFAGGMVPESNKNYSNKFLFVSEYEINQEAFNLLKKEKPFGKDIYYYSRTASWGETSFNGYSYVDLMKKEVTDKFIETTHKEYKKEVGDEFGKTVPSIFTDEPYYGVMSFGDSGYTKVLPFTDEIFKEFKERRGYDILSRISGLFYKTSDYRKARHDYIRTALELFIENYSKRIGKWCEKNNINYTGHYLNEDTFSEMIYQIGAAMPHYEYMQWPGIDHLCWDMGIKRPIHMTCKQVSSVSHQFEKERVLSELYGTSGWDLTFEGQKWIGDYEYVLGINLRCQHLALYTLRGCRKRDYPPSINYQSTWFKDYSLVEDYFGRLGYMLTKGKFKADILLLHSISSAWCDYEHKNEENDKYFLPFLELSLNLSGMHRDYDYGDEIIMSRHAAVRKGEISINKMTYKVVIIPPSLSWFKSTFDILKEFIKNGGKIIAIKELPILIEGEESNELKKFLNSGKITVVNNTKEEITAALDKMLEKDVSVKDNSGLEIEDIFYQYRVFERKHIYFFINKSSTKYHKAKINLFKKGKKEIWNAETGEITETNSSEFEFAPVSSLLLVVDESLPASVISDRSWDLDTEIPFKENWGFERLGLNAITLDSCSYKVKDGPWSNVIPVWKAQCNIRDEFKLKDSREVRFNGMEAHWISKNKIKYFPEGLVSLKYEFEVKNVSAKALAAIETPEKFRIFANGKQLDYKESGNNWWVDKTIKTLDISKNIKQGTNEIVLECNFSTDLEFESIYIIGEFGVFKGSEGKYYVDKELPYLESGDWVNQGYSFYAGEILYRQEISLPDLENKKSYLEFESFNAVLAKVYINGKEVGSVSWAPFRLDITKCAKAGNNLVQIKIIPSMRNLFGPHHLKDDETWKWHGPGEFSDEDRWTDEYLFVPYGIMPKTRVKIYK